MNINKIIRTVCIFIWIICTSCVSGSTQESIATEQVQKKDAVDSILEKLNKRTQELESYQCQIEYKHVQPSVFGVETLRKGVLYYSRQGDKPMLRVNFQILIQDEEEEQKYIEQYIIVDGELLPDSNNEFEGFWLVYLDYENKSGIFRQITHAYEPNQTLDVFDLISEYFPMVGFTKADELKEQFEITLPEKEKEGSGNFIQVNLKVKPNSIYKDEYVLIDFWIDEKLNLPAKIVAISTEPGGEPLDQKDSHELKFLKAKVNEKIDNKVFNLQIPNGFEMEIFPLDDN